jgi:hypothetical protein
MAKKSVTSAVLAGSLRTKNCKSALPVRLERSIATVLVQRLVRRALRANTKLPRHRLHAPIARLASSNAKRTRLTAIRAVLARVLLTQDLMCALTAPVAHTSLLADKTPALLANLASTKLRHAQ